MISPFIHEVKLVRGLGQPWSGVNPSGPAFMYQAQATPDVTVPASPVQAAQPPMPTSVPVQGQTPVLPPSPAAAAPAAAPSTGGGKKYILAGIAVLAFVGACLIPSKR